MRLIQSMKRPIQVVIILTTVLSFLVPMAPAAIVLAADDGPQFTLDGFKWQDILGDKWGLYKSESRVDNNLSATNPWTVNPTITFSSGHILWVSLRPLGQTDATSGIYVRIIWSPDTKTIAAYKDLWFQSLISEQNHDLNDTAHKQIGKEGDSNRILYITRESSPYMSYVHGNLLYSLPPNVLITIYGERLESYFIDSALIPIFKDLEQSAKDMLGLLTMSLKNVPPFTPGTYGEAQLFQERLAGILIAQLTRSGKRVSEQKVYFFRNDTVSDEYFKSSFWFWENLKNANDFNPFMQPGFAGTLSRDYAISTTGPMGINIDARYNYLRCINAPMLGTYLAKQPGKPVKGKVVAVVFDIDPEGYFRNPQGQKPQSLVYAEVDLEFKFIARITNIVTLNNHEQPYPTVEVKRAGVPNPIKVSISPSKDDIGSPNKPVIAAPEGWGFPLYYGDKIVMDQYDDITIEWLTGITMGFGAKKNFASFGYPTAEVWIGSTDSGTLDRAVVTANKLWIAAAVTLSGAVTSIGSSVLGYIGSTALGVSVGWVSSAVAVVSIIPLGVVAADAQWNPIAVELRSQVLMDIKDKTATFYTLEGNATLYNFGNNSKVSAATGQKASISSDGKLGSATTFKQTELSSDMTAFVKEMQTQLTTGQTAIDAQNTTNPTSNLPGPNNDSLNDFFKNSTTGPRPTWLPWLMIGIAALLIVMAILIQVQRKRRKLAPALSRPRPVTLSQPSAPVFPVRQTKQPQVATGQVCTKCGTQSQTGDPYCSACGSALVSKNISPTVIEPQTLQFCLKCGFQTRPGKKYCGRCGNALQAQIPATKPQVTAYCYKCGNPETEGSFFCRKCGAKLML